MEILWLDMSTLQRWTSSNSGLLYGNIMAGQLPQQTKFFNIWISTIEVFQQASLTCLLYTSDAADE